MKNERYVIDMMLQENGHIYRTVGERCDEVEIGYLYQSTDNISITEPLIKVLTEGGFCWGAIPILDVIKYAMREHPELIEQATQEIKLDDSLSLLGDEPSPV